MKLFSFKKPVKIENENVLINNLAKNHSFIKQGKHLIVEGYDEKTKQSYRAFYNLNGEFLFIRLKIKSHSVMLVSWKEEHDIITTQKIDNSGNRLTEISVYKTTDHVKQKLIKRTFISDFEGEEIKKTFYLSNKIRSEGEFSRTHFLYWMM